MTAVGWGGKEGENGKICIQSEGMVLTQVEQPLFLTELRTKEVKRSSRSIQLISLQGKDHA